LRILFKELSARSQLLRLRTRSLAASRRRKVEMLRRSRQELYSQTHFKPFRLLITALPIARLLADFLWTLHILVVPSC
jgi:hypothetical protein